MYARDRTDARQTPSRAHDDFPADGFAQNRVGGADVIFFFGRYRGSFETEMCPLHRFSGLLHHGVVGCAPVFQREIESLHAQFDVGHRTVENAQRFGQELLSGLVAFQNHDGGRAQMNSY